MPSRSPISRRCLTALDLGILPFLAPLLSQSNLPHAPRRNAHVQANKNCSLHSKDPGPRERLTAGDLASYDSPCGKPRSRIRSQASRSQPKYAHQRSLTTFVERTPIIGSDFISLKPHRASDRSGTAGRSACSNRLGETSLQTLPDNTAKGTEISFYDTHEGSSIPKVVQSTSSMRSASEWQAQMPPEYRGQMPYPAVWLWKTGFKAMIAQYNTRIPPEVRAIRERAFHGDAAFTSQFKTQIEQWEWWKPTVWDTVKPEDQEDFWLLATLWIMLSAPHDLLRFLRCTFRPQFVSKKLLTQSLEFSASRALKEQPYSRKVASFVDDFILTVAHLIETRPKKLVVLSQESIWLIVASANKVQLKEFYNLLDEYKIKMTDWTRLHFISALSNAKHFKTAVTAIKALLNQNENIGLLEQLNVLRIEQSASTFLSNIMREPELVSLGNDALFRLIKGGMKPSVYTYNILLDCAVNARDYALSKRLLSIMTASETKPNFVTWTILLNSAKRRMDVDEMRRIVDLYDSGVIEASNSLPMLNEILDCILKVEMQNPTASSFELMLKRFETHFSTYPLWKLGLIPKPDDHILLRPVAPKIHLTTMVIGYIKLCRNSQEVLTLYEHLNKEFRDPNSYAICLATTDHVFNAVIAALGKDRSRLNMCISIISDMSQPAPERTEQLVTGQAFVMAAPTAQTWTILIHALLTHHFVKDALHSLNVMRSRGIEPNDVTWGTLIYGLAVNNETSQVRSIIQRMEDEGIDVPEDVVWLTRRLDTFAPEPQGSYTSRLKSDAPASRQRKEDDRSTSDLFVPLPPDRPNYRARKHPVTAGERRIVRSAASEENLPEIKSFEQVSDTSRCLLDQLAVGTKGFSESANPPRSGTASKLEPDVPPAPTAKSSLVEAVKAQAKSMGGQTRDKGTSSVIGAAFLETTPSRGSGLGSRLGPVDDYPRDPQRWRYTAERKKLLAEKKANAAAASEVKVFKIPKERA